MRGVGFQNRQVADEIKRLVLHRHDVPGMGRVGFGLGQLVHCRLPSALGNLRVGGRQIRPRNMQVQDGLAVGFVLGMQEREGFGLVLRA